MGYYDDVCIVYCIVDRDCFCEVCDYVDYRAIEPYRPSSGYLNYVGLLLAEVLEYLVHGLRQLLVGYRPRRRYLEDYRVISYLEPIWVIGQPTPPRSRDALKPDGINLS